MAILQTYQPEPYIGCSGEITPILSQAVLISPIMVLITILQVCL